MKDRSGTITPKESIVLALIGFILAMGVGLIMIFTQPPSTGLNITLGLIGIIYLAFTVGLVNRIRPKQKQEDEQEGVHED